MESKHTAVVIGLGKVVVCKKIALGEGVMLGSFGLLGSGCRLF